MTASGSVPYPPDFLVAQVFDQITARAVEQAQRVEHPRVADALRRQAFLLALMDGEHDRARDIFDGACIMHPELRQELQDLEAERHKRQ